MKRKSLFVTLFSALREHFCGFDFPTENATAKAERRNISASNVEVYQLAPDSNQLMQSYVIRTTNGKLIVIDGGGNVDDSVPAYLPSALRAIAGVEAGEYFELDAWFISHAHNDHYYELAKMLNAYTATSNYKIKQFYFDIPPFNTDEFPYSDGEASYLAKLKTGLDNYASVNNIPVAENSTYYDTVNSSVINPTSVAQGLSITIDDVRFDVLQTWEKSRGGNANNQGIILKMYACEQTILFLQDSKVAAGNALLNNSADQLKSDIVQTAHHGQDAVTQDVYKAISAEVNLWPTPRWVWNNTTSYTIGETRKWLNGTDFSTANKRNIVACLYEKYPSDPTSIDDWNKVKDCMKIVLPYDWTIEGSETLTVPTFNLESGTYVGEQQITLFTVEANAEIYYTLDVVSPQHLPRNTLNPLP